MAEMDVWNKNLTPVAFVKKANLLFVKKVKILQIIQNHQKQEFCTCILDN